MLHLYFCQSFFQLWIGYSCHVDHFYWLRISQNFSFNDFGQTRYVHSIFLLTNLQRVTCNLQTATCYMQPVTCNLCFQPTSHLFCFKEDIVLKTKTSVLSVGVIDNDFVFKVGINQNIFSWKIWWRIEYL